MVHHHDGNDAQNEHYTGKATRGLLGGSYIYVVMITTKHFMFTEQSFSSQQVVMVMSSFGRSKKRE